MCDARVGHEEQAMKRKLRTLHAQHRGLYGGNRVTVHMKLWYAQLGRRRIYQFMKELRIQGKDGRRCRRTTVPGHRPHGIPDHVECNFQATKPRQLVVCDTTAIPLRGDIAYLAIVLDVFSRKIVVWALDRTPSAQLVVDTLRQVIARGPCDARIYHSDQATQYTSRVFQRVCETNHIRQSVGSVGDCYDNAMAESRYATLKSECTYDRQFEKLTATKNEIGVYINDYDNNKSQHSSIGYRATNDAERSFKNENANL